MVENKSNFQFSNQYASKMQTDIGNCGIQTMLSVEPVVNSYA